MREEACNMNTSLLKVPTSTYRFKKLLRHYIKWALLTNSKKINMKLGC